MSDSGQEDEHRSRRVVLVVPKHHVKTVKTALERHGKLDRTAKITPETCGQESFEISGSRRRDSEAETSNEHIRSMQARMCISTTIPYQLSEDEARSKVRVAQELDLHHLSKEIFVLYRTVPQLIGAPLSKNPLHKAVHEGLANLPPCIFTDLDLTIEALTTSFPESYSIYTPLLLLSHNAFASPPWQTLLSSHAPSSPLLQPLWSHISSAMNTTHIAINSPIPLTQSISTSSANILRSPVNITPIHGDFGPSPSSQTTSSPTGEDFTTALWVTTAQNGIHQTWAPMYTMFSRGNIREKTRLLHLPSVSAAPNPSAVVDMYAGIGYFAFSYRSAGLFPIFCFELNPWSVEGLRRGAERNGWSYAIYKNDGGEDVARDWRSGEKKDFYIFQMSNVYAKRVLALHRGDVSLVRHVNLGLLPRSRDSWEDAVELVDREGGGWVHAHENVGVEEMDERKKEVEGVFQKYLDDGVESKRSARVEHVERVKMYAPGVVHCVFDVRIDGTVGTDGMGRVH
jgi:tRNA wybutosine-synthesizing protein 2